MSKKTEKKVFTLENELEDWGSYMATKKAKLENQFQQAAKIEFYHATNLFRGIAIFVNGYTNPCADQLKRMMMEHGGIYHNYMRSNSTTHIIASNLPYSKIIQYRKSKHPLPLCKPEWITDSIKTNKLLDWRPYLLYNSTSVTQPQLLQMYKVNNNELKEENNDDEILIDEKIILNQADSSNLLESINSKSTFHNKSSISELYRLKPETSKVTQVTTIHENEQLAAAAAGTITKNNNNQKSHGSALSSKNEEFLNEFYNNSRLHHIATMAATFKEYVNEIRSKNTGSFPGLDRLRKLKVSQKSSIPNKTTTHSSHQKKSKLSDKDVFVVADDTPPIIINNKKKNKIIMHIDMDCFFVSVGLKDKPELRGLPVAVTHATTGNNRSNKSSFHYPTNNEEDNTRTRWFTSMAEIASCSYEARSAGIKNGMFLGQALKLCPNLKTIKYNFEEYKQVSYSLYNTVASYTLDIEAVSCDEMYADISSILETYNLTPLKFATIIREEIKQKTGCPVSTGFGSNKLQARLATKTAKPDGQFHLKFHDVQAYIGSIKVQDIPGIGYSIQHQLINMNVKICSELQKISLNILQKKFGKKTGEMLYNTCRGIDSSTLNIEHIRKSLSAEVNYGIRFENNQDARDFLKKLAKEVSNRLIKVNAKGRCITLKLMVRAKSAPKDPAKFMGHGVCDNYTKSKNLLTSIDDEIIITREILNLWEQMQQPAHDIRGIGIHISRLETLKKIHNTCMMKFITKGIQSAEVYDEKDVNSIELKKLEKYDNKDQTCFEYNNKINVKRDDSEAKKSSVSYKKLPLNVSNITTISYPTAGSWQIDGTIFNELPQDIRMEIMNYYDDNNESYIFNDVENQFIDSKLESEIKKPPPPPPPPEHCRTSRQSIEIIKNNDPNKIIPVSQEIADEQQSSVLITKQLSTNNIHKEILTLKPEKTIISLQSQNYFQQMKSTRTNQNKMKLPNVRELDMQVLIELPDDIRNEILNYYKSINNNHNNNEGENSKVNANEINNDSNAIQNIMNNNKENKNTKSVNNIKKPIDDINVSFSQIDPGFLAALSDDIKDDVKMYCIAKKKETKEVKMIKILNEETFNLAIKQPQVQNIIRVKKRGRPPKNTLKIVNNKNNCAQSTEPINIKKNDLKLKNSLKIKQHDHDHDHNVMVSRRRKSFLENKLTILNTSRSNDKGAAIKLHQGWKIIKSEEHQEMLTNLVNYLFSLPLYQVKNQMQTWILNSTHVNDIDTLSIATFLSMLPNEKRIEDLHILMKTMYRCITNSGGGGSCVWHETYRKTVEHVQHYMQIEYSSILMLPPIRCNTCC